MLLKKGPDSFFCRASYISWSQLFKAGLALTTVYQGLTRCFHFSVSTCLLILKLQQPLKLILIQPRFKKNNLQDYKQVNCCKYHFNFTFT